jgi:release factor glutamine methyltransferase
MAGGFVAADEEAEELIAAAGGDDERLEAMVLRREEGEPLAWITGSVLFCGLTLAVHKDVYVPRWHTELVAERAAQLLPEDGVGIDLCTGCGAVAAVLKARRPHARVIGTDLDPNAVANAKANGVEAYEGDLFEPVPPGLQVDVVVGVVPYVPRRALPLLQRDTFRFETKLAYDGGEEGLDILVKALHDAREWLKPDGRVVLEVGAAQAGDLDPFVRALQYRDLREIVDDEHDLRGIELRAPVTPS